MKVLPYDFEFIIGKKYYILYSNQYLEAKFKKDNLSSKVFHTKMGDIYWTKDDFFAQPRIFEDRKEIMSIIYKKMIKGQHIYRIPFGVKNFLKYCEKYFPEKLI